MKPITVSVDVERRTVMRRPLEQSVQRLAAELDTSDDAGC
jgi:hypothetical protein